MLMLKAEAVHYVLHRLLASDYFRTILKVISGFKNVAIGSGRDDVLELHRNNMQRNRL